MPLQSINPATGDVLRSFPAITEDAMRARIASAAEAAASFAAVPLEHRALCLRKIGRMLEGEAVEIARTIVMETGKPMRLAQAEVARCAAACSYYAEHAAKFLAPKLLPTDGGQAYIQWSPLGVVLAVMPWESPLWNVFRFLAPALMAGNVVLLKHAASVPQCALMLEALVRRAGFERGVLSSLLVEDRLVEAVLGDERVAAVTVTGSETAGRAIAAQAGWLMKKVALHLPGSDAFVVMPSANFEVAAAAAIAALTGAEGAGAAKRIIVHSGVYNDFLHRLVAAAEKLKIGDPFKDETDIGPLGTAEAADSLAAFVEAAVKAGGRIVTGGTRMIGKGNFFEPTLLSDVPRNASVAREAVAGPVACIYRARDVAEAMAIANGTPFGLGASAWTEEPAEQQQLLAGLQAGVVSLNSLPGTDPRLPYGGSKRSGFGRELGAEGMREFLQAKTVSLGR